MGTHPDRRPGHWRDLLNHPEGLSSVRRAGGATLFDDVRVLDLGSQERLRTVSGKSVQPPEKRGTASSPYSIRPSCGPIG